MISPILLQADEFILGHCEILESNTCITVATSSQLSLLKCAVPIRYTCNPCERGFIVRFRDHRIVLNFYLGARVRADKECAGGREVGICYLLWEDVFKLGMVRNIVTSSYLDLAGLLT